MKKRTAARKRTGNGVPNADAKTDADKIASYLHELAEIDDVSFSDFDFKGLRRNVTTNELETIRQSQFGRIAAVHLKSKMNELHRQLENVGNTREVLIADLLLDTGRIPASMVDPFPYENAICYEPSIATKAHEYGRRGMTMKEASAKLIDHGSAFVDCQCYALAFANGCFELHLRNYEMELRNMTNEPKPTNELLSAGERAVLIDILVDVYQLPEYNPKRNSKTDVQKFYAELLGLSFNTYKTASQRKDKLTSTEQFKNRRELLRKLERLTMPLNDERLNSRISDLILDLEKRLQGK